MVGRQKSWSLAMRVSLARHLIGKPVRLGGCYLLNTTAFDMRVLP
jgi:hypothetical protein